MELFNDRSGSTQSLKDLYDLQEEYRLYQTARKDSKALKVWEEVNPRVCPIRSSRSLATIPTGNKVYSRKYVEIPW